MLPFCFARRRGYLFELILTLSRFTQLNVHTRNHWNVQLQVNRTIAVLPSNSDIHPERLSAFLDRRLDKKRRQTLTIIFCHVYFSFLFLHQSPVIYFVIFTWLHVFL